MTGWAAQALRARAAGSRRGVLEACRRGLDVLDDHRMTLGASELRAHASAQGAELAALAQEVSLAQGSPRRLLGWSERWRATVLTATADPAARRSGAAERADRLPGDRGPGGGRPDGRPPGARAGARAAAPGTGDPFPYPAHGRGRR
ncbi:hypothetical protein GCM10017687_77700 [Streptomyces echinatus]